MDKKFYSWLTLRRLYLQNYKGFGFNFVEGGNIGVGSYGLRPHFGIRVKRFKEERVWRVRDKQTPHQRYIAYNRRSCWLIGRKMLMADGWIDVVDAKGYALYRKGIFYLQQKSRGIYLYLSPGYYHTYDWMCIYWYDVVKFNKDRYLAEFLQVMEDINTITKSKGLMLGIDKDVLLACSLISGASMRSCGYTGQRYWDIMNHHGLSKCKGLHKSNNECLRVLFYSYRYFRKREWVLHMTYSPCGMFISSVDSTLYSHILSSMIREGFVY